MASQFVPVRAGAFTFEIPGMYSQADPTIFQVNPTIAAGDFWIMKDGGGWNALTNTPTLITAGSVDTAIQFVLTGTEMTADRVMLKWVDAAGAEWISGATTLYTGAVGYDGLATPTNITAGTITTVTNLTNAPTNGDLTATMKTSVTTAATAATPVAASVTGAVGSVTGAVGSVTGAVGSVTGNVGGNVVGSVASVTATVNADVKKINAVTVVGAGTAGDLWRA